MIILQNTLIILATFFLMEFAAWALHKYIMHGFLWTLHHDHHNPTGHHFEKNDSFLLIFAVPSALLMYYGLSGGGVHDFRVWIGVGIAVYGFIYFVVHDVFIHQRFKAFKRSKNPYLLAIRKAHKIHHKYLEKEDGECFGMLLVPWKYYRDAWAYTKKLKAGK